jgi:Ras-related protein Rab-5C
MYYRDAAAAICVFDITSRSTLENAENWIKDLKSFAPSHIIIALCGNKSDLFAQEEVNLE